ncbi:hypothetical protein H8N03_04995 [Ramlibacter sp. USB13]|uniref:Uncharacterized protein n=1 Tax=Ramlibacter cellulosilyticus TaxID=2764187 RepID=A0A923SA08_9BURK|nr:hypothetical protein [Ramlibacter cellulosilyticus]MBC5782290.1 hypothetical protein [Ramlibacter cellulosilyticus]
MPELNPQPLPPGDRVRVFVNHDIAFDLQKMNKITANVLGKLGCGGCHSGRILEFVTLRDFVVNPRTLDVQEFAGSPLARSAPE